MSEDIKLTIKYQTNNEFLHKLKSYQRFTTNTESAKIINSQFSQQSVGSVSSLRRIQKCNTQIHYYASERVTSKRDINLKMMGTSKGDNLIELMTLQQQAEIVTSIKRLKDGLKLYSPQPKDKKFDMISEGSCKFNKREPHFLNVIRNSSCECRECGAKSIKIQSIKGIVPQFLPRQIVINSVKQKWKQASQSLKLISKAYKLTLLKRNAKSQFQNKSKNESIKSKQVRQNHKYLSLVHIPDDKLPSRKQQHRQQGSQMRSFTLIKEFNHQDTSFDTKTIYKSHQKIESFTELEEICNKNNPKSQQKIGSLHSSVDSNELRELGSPRNFHKVLSEMDHSFIQELAHHVKRNENESSYQIEKEEGQNSILYNRSGKKRLTQAFLPNQVTMNTLYSKFLQPRHSIISEMFNKLPDSEINSSDSLQCQEQIRLKQKHRTYLDSKSQEINHFSLFKEKSQNNKTQLSRINSTESFKPSAALKNQSQQNINLPLHFTTQNFKSTPQLKIQLQHLVSQQSPKKSNQSLTFLDKLSLNNKYKLNGSSSSNSFIQKTLGNEISQYSKKNQNSSQLNQEPSKLDSLLKPLFLSQSQKNIKVDFSLDQSVTGSNSTASQDTHYKENSAKSKKSSNNLLSKELNNIFKPSQKSQINLGGRQAPIKEGLFSFVPQKLRQHTNNNQSIDVYKTQIKLSPIKPLAKKTISFTVKKNESEFLNKSCEQSDQMPNKSSIKRKKLKQLTLPYLKSIENAS